MRRALAAGATLAAVALGGGGCGSGDGGSAGGSGGSAGSSPGAKVFADTGCGSCHTLKAAGTTGSVGPALDGRDYDPVAVQRWVTAGGSGMPSYRGQLSPEEIRSVSAFVAAASRAR